MTNGQGAAIRAMVVLLAGCFEQRQTVPPTNVAGGDTSELSGGTLPAGYCPEEGATFTELPLDSEQMAPWIALAAGRHEATLAWQPAFVSDALAGYKELTSLALDVTVLSARDVVFGEANLGYEGEGCNGSKQRQIRLAINLRTADGALSGSFEHWVTAGSDPNATGGRVLSSAAKVDNGVFPFSAFASTLELEVQPFVEQRRELQVSLAFDAEGMRGALAPRIMTLVPAGENGPGMVTPLRATFPDDGCSPAKPVSLDEHQDEIGMTPRAAYERLRAGMERAPIRARWWQEYASPRRDAGFEWTEVILRGGEPERACSTAATVRVHAPLTIQTDDGLAQHTQTVAIDLSDGHIESDGSLPLVPVADFERTTGLRGFDFTGIDWAGVYFSSSGMRGHFGATKWEQTEQRLMDPSLEWCGEADCNGF